MNDTLNRNTFLLFHRLQSTYNTKLNVQWIYLSVSDTINCTWELLSIKTEMNVQNKSCLEYKLKQNQFDKYSFTDFKNQCLDLTVECYWSKIISNVNFVTLTSIQPGAHNTNFRNMRKTPSTGIIWKAYLRECTPICNSCWNSTNVNFFKLFITY